MESNIKCDICLQGFVNLVNLPRLCHRCGNSLCENCLNGIYKKHNAYICPYCKAQSTQNWPKNLKILSILQQESKAIVCNQHKGKVVSFCTNPQCNVSVGICQMTQCSKMHKQRGTNNIPISLLTQYFQSKDTDKISRKAVELFYHKLQQELIKQLRLRRADKLKSLKQNQLKNSRLSGKIQGIINKLKDPLEQSKIKSKDMLLIKQQILQSEDDGEIDTAKITKGIIKSQKQMLQVEISKLINEVDINYSAQNLKSLIREEPPKIINEPMKIQKKQIAQLSKQFIMIQQTLKKQFQPQLIYSSIKENSNVTYFKKIAGKANLVYRIQLEDGNIFGVYFKKPYANNFNSDYYVVDNQAFVFWVNRAQIFKAAPNSVAQYDISPKFLLSVGNTYKSDGFWFKSDFKTLNPPGKKKIIASQQYQGLSIPINTFNTIKVQIFQLLF